MVFRQSFVSKLAPGSQSPEYNTLVVICCNCLFVLVSSVLLLALATAVGAAQAQLLQAGFAAPSAVQIDVASHLTTCWHSALWHTQQHK